MAAEVDRAKRICHAAKGQVIDMFHAARLGKAIDPVTTLHLVDEIAASVERHPIALLSVARLKTHDDYTYLHSVSVCALMLSLARQLDLDEEQTHLAGAGGLMHDLGKSAMPLDVLNKPGKLTDEEFDVVKRHPAAGAQMLLEGGYELVVQDIALHHQEKFDGTGYRVGSPVIKSLCSPACAPMCDVYDAITSERDLQEGLGTRPWRCARWRSGEGTSTSDIFNAFVRTVGIYPVGSLVRLASQRLAVVVEPGTESLLKPRRFASSSPSARTSRSRCRPSISLRERCKDSIAAPEDPAKWGFTNLDQLWVE